MKRKKKIILALNLLLGGFITSALVGCNEQTSQFYSLDIKYDETLGTVTTDTPQGVAGDTVNIKITPNEGVIIESVVVNGTEVEVTDGTLTFTAIGGLNTVDVNFKDPAAETPIDNSFSVELDYDSSRGTVVADKTSGTNYLDSNSAVKITITPNNGYYVQSIVVNDEDRDASATEFAFQPQKGLNTVKVLFGESEGPVEETKKYSFTVTYNEEGGTVIGDKTAGDLVEGTVTKFTVTPKDNYIVKSVLFNGTELTLEADGVYEVKPVEGANTFDVVFVIKEVEPTENTYSIEVMVNDENGGTFTLSKTSGEVGETVDLTISPNSGYLVSVMFNGGFVTLDDDYRAVLTPNKGTNQLDIIFSKPQSGLGMLEGGYNVDLTDKSLLGTPDFDSDYFYENCMRVIYDSIPNGEFEESEMRKYSDEFYNNIISKLSITKESAEHLMSVMKETDAVKKFTELSQNNSNNLDRKTFTGYVSLVLELKGKLTQDEFSYFVFSFGSYMNIGLVTSSYSGRFAGLNNEELSRAANYFENHGDSATASEIRAFSDSINAEQQVFSVDDLLTTYEKPLLYASRLLYPMADALSAIETDKDKLGGLLYDAIEIFNKLTNGGSFDFLLDEENKARNIEVFQFIGKVLFRALPNIESFKEIIKKSDLVQDMVDAVKKLNSFVSTSLDRPINDSFYERLKEDGESLYYLLKFIGKSLENLQTTDYDALVGLLSAMMSGEQASQENVYKYAIKISKLFVRTLTEFGAASTTLTEHFADGVSLFGELYAVNNRLISYGQIQENIPDEDSERIKKFRTNVVMVMLNHGTNLFGNYDFSKLPEFIANVSTYDPEKIGETEMTYIQNFIAEIQQAIGTYATNENYSLYQIEYADNPDLNGDLGLKISEPESGQKVDYTVGEYDTKTRTRKSVNINFDGFGSVDLFYEVGILDNTVIGKNLRIELQSERFSTYGHDFVIRNDHTYAAGDGLYLIEYDQYQETPKRTLIKALNLNTSELGWHYIRCDIDNNIYFLKYYVYRKEDIKYDYHFELSDIYLEGEMKTLNSIYYQSYVEDEDGERVHIDSGHKELKEAVTLDTSKVGGNSVDVELIDGTKLTVSYYVCEIIEHEKYLDSTYIEAEFYYQGLELQEKYGFYYVEKLTYVDRHGKEETIEHPGSYIDIGVSEFENGLSNTEAGEHIDYVTIDGERYQFTYYVNERLESSDTDFEYYVDTPYIEGSGFEIFDGETCVSRAQRLFYENRDGEVFSIVNFDESARFYVDYSMIDTSNAVNALAGDMVSAKIAVSPEETIHANLFVSSLRLQYHDYWLDNLSYLIPQNLPDDDYEVIISRNVDYIYDTWRGYEEGINIPETLGTFKFGDIKNYLDFEYPGNKSFNFEYNGNVYEVWYSVTDISEMSIGNHIEGYDDSKNSHGLHVTGLEGKDKIVIKLREGYISDLNFSSSRYITDEFYVNEYTYYILDVSESSDIWLYSELYGEYSIEVMDFNQFKHFVEQDSLRYDLYLMEEENVYCLQIFYYQEITIEEENFGIEADKVLTYTLEELQTLYLENGDGNTIHIDVEIDGEIFTIDLDVSNYPEIIG